MTKTEFKAAMKEIRKQRRNNTGDEFLCNQLSEVMGQEARIRFNSIFKPEGAGLWTFQDEFDKVNDEDDTANQIKADKVRLVALQLFELMCLEYKLYESF